MTNAYATQQIWADLVCLACTRKTATRIAEEGRPAVIRLEPGVHPEYARRRVCPTCRGPLWFADPYTLTVPRRLPPELLNPKPGRPKAAEAPKTEPCVDCGALRPMRGNDTGLRCHPCATGRPAALARDRALVEVLARASRPMGSRELADLLGYATPKQLRDRVKWARTRGARIVRVGRRGYALEVAS